jgi:hypothetical protein
MDLRKVTMKYGRLVAFIRHGAAEVWGLGMNSNFSLVFKKLLPEPAFSCVWFVLSKTLLRIFPQHQELF